MYYKNPELGIHNMCITSRVFISVAFIFFFLIYNTIRLHASDYTGW